MVLRMTVLAPTPRLSSLLIAGAAALCAALPAAAQSQEEPRARAALSAGWAEADGSRIAGWKTYWRQPGDAGVPPDFDWTGSRNVASVEVVWPEPELFDSFGALTIGYKHAMTLPLRVVPERPQEPMELALRMNYGVCSDICVPEQARLSLSIAPDDRDGAQEIAAAMARRALTAQEAGVSVDRCTVTGAGSERKFDGAFRARQPLDAAVAVVEGPAGVWFSPADVGAADGALTASSEAWLDDPERWVDRDSLKVTLLGGGAFVEVACGG